MNIFIEKIILVNRAPFSNLALDFAEKGVSILASENGRGKTTILSHIVDAFYEMARRHFPSEFEGKENKLYRVSSVINNLDQNKPSFVYIRFKSDETNIDYVDIRNVCSEEEYNNAIPLENKIPFTEIKPQLDKSDYSKNISTNFDQAKAKEIFYNNLLTYFPSYRYESPGYLNDPYQIELNFTKKHGFSGFLRNPIEVVAGLPQLANWLMDIVLDLRIGNDPQTQTLFETLNSIITLMLKSKSQNNLRFGIGPRGFGGTRIQIVEKNEPNVQIYPTIFNLSSGESSLLCLFGEIVRQFDNISPNISPSEAKGIVLVDEIDKHLHIKLQKEILPALLSFFPNIQFIISSHSPFLSLGLAEILQDRSRLIDIKNGISIEPRHDEQYLEVYEMMISENENYKSMYESIVSKVEDSKELQIITEGKNTEHIEKAISVLDSALIDKVAIITGSEDKSGDQQLKNTFDIMSNAEHSSKFLFIWDCDSLAKAQSVTETSSFFSFCFPLNEGNSKAKKGIENLYDEIFFTEDVYDEKTTEIDYGGSKTEKIFNKGKFLEKIKQNDEIATFSNYSSLIDKITSALT